MSIGFDLKVIKDNEVNKDIPGNGNISMLSFIVKK
jgi:hypothetical protein